MSIFGRLMPSRFHLVSLNLLHFLSQLLVAIREANPEEFQKKSPLEWYKSEIEKSPNDKSLWYALGSLLAKTGEHEKAVETFERVTWLDPLHLKAWDAKGKALIRLGRFQEASECYERATELDSRDERLWFQKGETLLKLQKLKEALKCYERAIEIDPNFSDAWYGRGQALRELDSHLRTSDLDEDSEESEQLESERMISKEAKIRNVWGTDHRDYLEGDGRSDQPSEDPSNKEDRLLAANMQRYGGNTEEALRLYDKAIEADPNFLDAWYHKGTLLYIMDRYEDAFQCFGRALVISPDHEWSKKRMAEIETLTRGERQEEARAQSGTKETEDQSDLTVTKAFKDSWEKNATKDELEKKARECFIAGEFETALVCYDRLLEIDRNDWKAWKGKGTVYSLMGRGEDATQCFERALKLNPTDESLWYDEGRTLHARGDRPEALVALKKAVELEPELADAWYEAGTILKSLGLSRDAHNAIQEAFEKYFVEMLQGRKGDAKKEPRVPLQGPKQETLEQFLHAAPHHLDIDRFDRNILLALWNRSRTV
ncbi:MAG: tetratricopeptide repeat protein, partial [Thermoplasmata archaeon]